VTGKTFNNPTPALAGNFLAGLHWRRHRAARRSFKMISFSNINKQYGKQLLFVDASFQLNPGEKVGLVGPTWGGQDNVIPYGGRRGNSRRGCGLSPEEVDDRLLSPGRRGRSALGVPLSPRPHLSMDRVGIFLSNPMVKKK